jgi:hypothetical protein
MSQPIDPISLGVVLAVLGMGGTLLTLFVFSLLIDLLKRLFPVAPPAPGPAAGPSANRPAASTPQPGSASSGGAQTGSAS